MRFSFVKYFTTILLFIVILLFSSIVSKAQTQNNPAADMQFWIRLDARILVLPNNDTVIELKTGNIAQKQNTTVYIAECVDTSTDRICSTGTEKGDMVVYQSTENLKKMKDLYGYQFSGMTDAVKKTPIVNPVKSNNNGEIPTVLLKSLMMVNVSRKFYGVNIVTDSKEVKSLDALEQLGTGNEGGQQQGMFKVKIPPPTPKPVILDQGAAPRSGSGCSDTGDDGLKCCSYNKQDGCDPYGRVFDAVSLEPIPNTKVTLIKQRADGNFTFMTPKETVNAIINPWMTKEDGKFVFLVPAGTYQLSVELPNYTFPFVPSQLNPNYAKAYYELYYGNDFTDQNIVELKVEHRDIPVIPRAVPYRGPVNLLGYIAELDKEKQMYKISGRTSHPLTIVEVLGKKIDTSEATGVLAKTTADKWGFFNANISTSMLKPNEIVGMVKMIKVDLTETTVSPISQKKNTLSSFFSSLFKFFPRSSSFAEKEKPKTLAFTLVPINPILNYLEGYAYDTNNKPIPHAKVGIYLTGSKKPYYVGKSDENGYFIITSQHLPQMNYFIEYTTPEGKNFSVTQTTFLEQNIKTLLSENINVNTYITQLSPFKVSAKERTPFSNQVTQNKINPSVDNIKNISNSSKNNTMVIIAVIFFIVCIFFFAGIMFFIKRKNP